MTLLKEDDLMELENLQEVMGDQGFADFQKIDPDSIKDEDLFE